MDDLTVSLPPSLVQPTNLKLRLSLRGRERRAALLHLKIALTAREIIKKWLRAAGGGFDLLLNRLQVHIEPKEGVLPLVFKS